MPQMNALDSKYRFVVLRKPYEIMDYELPRNVFPGIVSLKTRGYRQEYRKEVLPFDSSDFVATHLLLCDMTRPNPRPVLGFKSVTLELCDLHKIPFPMLGMLERQDDHKNDREVIERKLDIYRKQGRSAHIAYNGSFTILPELRADKILMKHLWDLSFSLLANYYCSSGIDHVMAVCATKFHVNKKKELFGWNYIQGPNGKLEEYPSKCLFGNGLVPMELNTAHPDCQKSRQLFLGMWENRIEISEEILQMEEKIAA